MASDSGREKTEAPSQKRRQDVRNKGQVARSREINSAAVLLGGLIAFYFFGQYMVDGVVVMTRHFFAEAAALSMDENSVRLLMGGVLRSTFLILFPFMLMAFLVGLVASYLQVGFIFSAEPITPKLSKMDPVQGMKRIFSKKSLVELIKSILKVAVIVYLAYGVFKEERENFLALSQVEIGGIFSYLMHVAFRVVLRVGIFLVVMAALDYGFQRWEFEREIMMTKEEVKEEFKEREGNPQVKARIRSLQREVARRRMMAEVPKADVVVTNPTTLAVALKYVKEEMEAPMVAAKGQRYMAEKIKAIAREHGVPLVENKMLARALFKAAEVGQIIPPDLYKAVAEVLAYVYRLRNHPMAHGMRR